MVKFLLSIIVAAVLASAPITVIGASSSDGTIVRNNNAIKLSNTSRKLFRRGNPQTEALLKHALPYHRRVATANASDSNNNLSTTRRRQLENDYAFDGSYNIKFSQCVDLHTYNENLFQNADIVEDTRDGNVASVKSFVLFHVCTDATCDYDAEDDLYVIDLPTYLKSVATYHANKRYDYCTQCLTFEDTCNPQEEEEAVEEKEQAAEGEEEEVAEEEQEQAGEGGEEEGAKEENAEEEGEKEEQEQEAQQQAEEGEQEEQGEEGEDREQDQEGEKEEGGDEEGERGEEGEGGEERQLRQLKQAIDCDQCQAYECYYDEAAEDDALQNKNNLDASVSNWIGELAECKASGVQSADGYDLYMSAICDSYGDGVELALFLDEDCTMYTTNESFYNTYDSGNGNDDDGINYLTYAEEFIKSAFSETMSCLQVEYADANEEAEDDEEEKYQMNDYCTAILESDNGVADFNNCDADVDAWEGNLLISVQYHYFYLKRSTI